MIWGHFPSRTALRNAYLLIGIVAGAISYGADQSQNFDVFTQAVVDLFRHADLYERHAADYYKYSPTFALLFAPFVKLPPWIGATLWSAVNFMVAFSGIEASIEDEEQQRVALTIALLGIVIVTDGDQSNLLVAGLFLLAVRAYEDMKPARAAFLTMGAAFIKLFPIAAAGMLLFHPKKMRSIVWLVVAGLLLAALPLLVLMPSRLLFEYQSWRALVAKDSGSWGWSVMHMMRPWTENQRIGQIAGTVIMGLAFVIGWARQDGRLWRLHCACAMLLYAVLFNHRAESSTFVIPAIAVAIWAATTKPSWWKNVLVIACIIFPGPIYTEAARTKIFGDSFLAILIAKRLFHPLRLVPFLIVWGLLLASMIRAKRELGKSPGT